MSGEALQSLLDLFVLFGVWGESIRSLGVYIGAQGMPPINR